VSRAQGIESVVYSKSERLTAYSAAYLFYIKELFSVGDPDGYEISLYPLHNGVHQNNYEV